MLEQHRVEHELAVAVVQDGHDERVFAVAVDALADQIGALVAVEQTGQDLDLVVRLDPVAAEQLLQPRFHLGHVTLEVGKCAVELEVAHHARQGVAQAILARVVHAVGGGGILRFDVFGGNDRAHENIVVIEIRAVQDVATDGIEEGFRQFRLLVFRQHADVVQLEFAPHFVAQLRLFVLIFEHLHAFLHALVIIIDAFAGRRLRRGPGALFEILLGLLACFAEQAVMLVEAVADGARDIECNLGREQFGEGNVRHVCARINGSSPSRSSRARAYLVSANSSRPISMRRISLVPAPISYSLASRHRRPAGYSLM
ncbi:hypothetical protein D3C72_1097080 [compost metagenome]